MIDTLLYGTITKLTFFAIVFLFIFIISYIIQYISYKKIKKAFKIRNHIFIWCESLIFSIAIFIACSILFNGMRQNVYTDVMVGNYELCNYKSYTLGITEDTYVFSDSPKINNQCFILIKTPLGSKPLTVTSNEYEPIVMNILDNTKPSYTIYERKYKNIYITKKYKQHIINIPRGTIKINYPQ